MFVEKFFLSEKEFSEYIFAGDIFVAPYLAKNQISSGALVYAMAHKMCIVTTPFTHAKHEISSKIGYLVKHKSSKMIAKAVNSLLNNPARMRMIQENAYKRVKDRQWPKIAVGYLDVFREVMHEQSKA
jgi:glycosyltransferase involved in cell wall biosynthesis